MLQGLSDNLRNDNIQSTYPAWTERLSDARHLAGVHVSLPGLVVLLSWVCMDTKFYYGEFPISDSTNLRNGACILLLMEVYYTFTCTCLHRGN